MLKILVLPALNDQLKAHQIDRAALSEALEAYAQDLQVFIDRNYNQYQDPIPWIEVTDHQNTLKAFLELLPKISPDDTDFEEVDQ